MPDLSRVFEGLERLDAPVTWSDVRGRKPGPPLPEPERTRRILVVGLALAVAAIGVALIIRAFVLAPGQRPGGSATPTPHAPSSPKVTSCVLARTTGDFDGDGTPDVAALVLLAPAGETCREAQYGSGGPPDFHLRVSFGSGGTLDHRFTYCPGGPCGAEAFTATDLDGDGRSELAVEVGPGAAVDFVEFFRVERDAVHPLQIKSVGAAKAHLKPGPAILGGGFDSTLQSPVACEVRPDGTRVLVSIQAEMVGNSIEGPWRVTHVELELRGDTLHIVAISTTTTRHGFKSLALRFRVVCS